MIEGTHIVTHHPEPPGPKPRDVEAFVLNSWLRSYEPRGIVHNGGDVNDARARTTYYRTHHPALQRLVLSCTVAICVTDEDPDTFVGWAVGKPGLLHYVYVKSGARRNGAAAELVRAVAGDGALIYTFEPGKRDGRVCRALVDVAAGKGWRFHAHPIPGMSVHQQRKASAHG